MAQVYFISNGTAYKIGVASKLQQRLRQLSTGSSTPLEVLAVSRDMAKGSAHFLEKSIHKNLRQYCKKGEWFQLPEFLVDVVRRELSLKV